MAASRRVVGATLVATVLVGLTAPAGAHARGAPGRVVIIQAVPTASFDVTVDGRPVRRGTSVRDVLGPLTVSPGRHRIGFSDPSDDIRLHSTVDVSAGSSSDIVVHLPASVDGAPVVNSYKTPRAAIAPGKARVLIAHTATVAPADVRVDGEVVFRDIANGEFATADLAAGSHTVALLPAGLHTHPILGPLDVDLEAGTVTMVYAFGNPRDHSMNVIAHTARLASNGAVVPVTIDTGRAGLAARVVVHPFGVPPPQADTAAYPGPAHGPWLPVGGGMLLGAGIVLVVCRRKGAPIRSG